MYVLLNHWALKLAEFLLGPLAVWRIVYILFELDHVIEKPAYFPTLPILELRRR